MPLSQKHTAFSLQIQRITVFYSLGKSTITTLKSNSLYLRLHGCDQKLLHLAMLIALRLMVKSTADRKISLLLYAEYYKSQAQNLTEFDNDETNFAILFR
jgi:hypothetical protein